MFSSILLFDHSIFFLVCTVYNLLYAAPTLAKIFASLPTLQFYFFFVCVCQHCTKLCILVWGWGVLTSPNYCTEHGLYGPRKKINWPMDFLGQLWGSNKRPKRQIYIFFSL